MSNLPLGQDTVFNGLIYLKGETGYGEDLIQALAEKENSVKRVQDSPLFQPVQQHTNATHGVDPSETGARRSVITIPQPPVPSVELIELSGGDEGTELPEEFPYRELFTDAGFDTIEKVLNVPHLTEIDGIGPARETEVQAWITANIDLNVTN